MKVRINNSRSEKNGSITWSTGVVNLSGINKIITLLGFSWWKLDNKTSSLRWGLSDHGGRTIYSGIWHQYHQHNHSDVSHLESSWRNDLEGVSTPRYTHTHTQQDTWLLTQTSKYLFVGYEWNQFKAKTISSSFTLCSVLIIKHHWTKIMNIEGSGYSCLTLLC